MKDMRRAKYSTTLAVIFWAFACLLQAQSSEPARTPDWPYLETVGQGTASAKPDQAIVGIGVVSEASTAAAAAADNSKQTTAVLAEVAKVLGADKHIRTFTYSVTPVYGNVGKIARYRATNSVEVTIDDLAQVAKVIDVATQSGANSVQRVQWSLKNPAALHAEALRKAVEQARASADAIAAVLGNKVRRVRSVKEENAGGPVYGRLMTDAAAPLTPLEAGLVEEKASVVMRVEVYQ